MPIDRKQKQKTKRVYSPSLPPEIRMQIISYFTDDRSGCMSCSFGALFSLSLVAKGWNSSANYALYNHLRLDRLSTEGAHINCPKHTIGRDGNYSPRDLPLTEVRPGYADWARNKLADDTDIPPVMFRKLATLLGSLQRYQHIADTVRSITINGDCMLSNCTAGIISACDYLEYLRRDEDFFTGITRPILQQAVTTPGFGGNDWEDVVELLEEQRLGSSPPPPNMQKAAIAISRSRSGVKLNSFEKGTVDRNESSEGQSWLELERARRIQDSAEFLRLPKDVFMASIATRSYLKSIELTYTLGETPYPQTYPLPIVIKADKYHPLERWYRLSEIEEAYFTTSSDLSSLGSWNHEPNNSLRGRCHLEMGGHISKFLREAKKLKQLKLEGRPEYLMELLEDNNDKLKSIERLSLLHKKYVTEPVRNEIWALVNSLVQNRMLPKLRNLECLVGDGKMPPDSKKVICLETLEYHTQGENNTIPTKMTVETKRVQYESTHIHDEV